MTNRIGEKKRIASLILGGLLAFALMFGLIAMAGCGNADPPKTDPPKEDPKKEDPKPEDPKKEDPKPEDPKKEDPKKEEAKPKTEAEYNAMKLKAEERAQKLIQDGVALEITKILIFPADAPDGYVIEYLIASTRKPATYTTYIFQG